MLQSRLTICCLIACLLASCDRKLDGTDSSDDRAVQTFGQRQLQQMLDDRPDMQNVIPRNHSVYTWLSDGFDGKRFGQRIYWNSDSPQSGRPAEHLPPSAGYPPSILVSGGTESTPVEKWAFVVYEMFNLEMNNSEALVNLAIEGSIDADEYASKCLEAEFNALLEAHKYFHDNPLPKSQHGRDRWYNWLISDIGTFEEYKKSTDVPWANSTNSNYEYFKQYYESTLRPYREGTHRGTDE